MSKKWNWRERYQILWDATQLLISKVDYNGLDNNLMHRPDEIQQAEINKVKEILQKDYDEFQEYLRVKNGREYDE